MARIRKHYWELSQEQKDRAKARVKRWREADREFLELLKARDTINRFEQGRRERRQQLATQGQGRTDEELLQLMQSAREKAEGR